MGYFTWTDAKKIPLRRRDGDFRSEDKIWYGRYAKIVCPDGTVYEESYYDGYGMFGDVDAYEVVVDMNKPYLKSIFERLESADGDFWGHELKDAAIAYSEDRTDALEKILDELVKTGPKYILYERGDWKRSIGIAISCDDGKNEQLPYPLKITSLKRKVDYDDLVPSLSTQ